MPTYMYLYAQHARVHRLINPLSGGVPPPKYPKGDDGLAHPLPRPAQDPKKEPVESLPQVIHRTAKPPSLGAVQLRSKEGEERGERDAEAKKTMETMKALKFHGALQGQCFCSVLAKLLAATAVMS